jgi:hypothetical protein
MDLLEMLGLTPRLGLLAAGAGVAVALLVAVLSRLRRSREPGGGLDLHAPR